MNLPEVTVIDENGEPINLKLWSETNDPEEQQEIFEAWEELYRKKEEIKNLKKTIKLTKKEEIQASKIRIDRTTPTFEEWKKEQGIEPRKQKVKPKKIHPKK